LWGNFWIFTFSFNVLLFFLKSVILCIWSLQSKCGSYVLCCYLQLDRRMNQILTRILDLWTIDMVISVLPTRRHALSTVDCFCTVCVSEHMQGCSYTSVNVFQLEDRA
jgi:hypothetical protein